MDDLIGHAIRWPGRARAAAASRPTAYANLRRRVTVPLAAGEQFGDLCNGNLPLVEHGLIDYSRTSIPNYGGITSYRVLAALCEAHSVGAAASEKIGARLSRIRRANYRDDSRLLPSGWSTCRSRQESALVLTKSLR